MLAPLICAADREVAAVPAHDFDVAAAAGDMAGHQFGDHAVGDVAQFETIGVADHQQQADHRPEQHRLQRLRQPLAEQHEHQAADENHQHELERERPDVVAQQIGDGVLIVARDQRGQRQRHAKQENPDQAAAHGVILRAGGLARRRGRRRRGSSAMTRARSAALMAVQRAISSSVRPQPRHSPDADRACRF